ncbi:hypothetical protein NLI96_g12561 [Meripilus lineatus]|uniref:Uncharacterized protein n=1 Tax=Meripilus lineatus TaxID=2056292 RepID=A0AAD5Y830_9APHY|nr:hypothetical protein NLI96_g12561 [Physisporinus lineatus]
MPRNSTPRNSQRRSPVHEPSSPLRSPRDRRASPRRIAMDLNAAAELMEKERRKAIRVASLERRVAYEKEKEKDAEHRRELDRITADHLNRSGSGNSVVNGTNQPRNSVDGGGEQLANGQAQSEAIVGPQVIQCISTSNCRI